MSAVLKECANGNMDGVAEKDVLSVLGYRISDFSDSVCRQNILSRLDVGTVVLQKEKIDVFTILVLAADNLEEF